MPPVSGLFTDSMMAQVAARRAVVLADHGSILLQVTGFCERRNVRTFVVASQPLESSPFGYVFSRSIDERFFRKLFDKYRRVMETGLMPKWLADSKGNWQRCIQTRNIAVDSISLDDTVPFFLLWGIIMATGNATPFRILFHHEADAGMSMMALTYERHSVVRFGPCIDTIDFSMLSSASPNQFDAFSYIRAFDAEVWIAVFACLICLSCLAALGEWKTALTRSRKYCSLLGSAYGHGWDLFGLLFAESSPRRYVLASQKLLMVAWLLTVVVLANSFGSLLKSKQAVSTFKPDVDSVDDLAARPYLTPVIPSGNYYETFARHSRSLAVKQVWERSRSRGAMPPVSGLFTDSMMAQVAARRAVVLADHGSILLQVTGFCERRNVRTFVVASQPLESSPFGYVFSRSIDERFFRKLFDK
ncbi:hypothetical protein HPB52_009078 [Rhipicephalus sanguineus]|uniref:Ionotropic receptor n=1 Tax=Rhipicephalus sanguineus TaxID=34632 RepID=A0A9D4SVY0_RHISA|nr:hypothetical protein HPB52_009078 [Rhipicephalus sanguineus]